MIDPKAVSARVAARKQAEEVLGLILEAAAEVRAQDGPEAAEAYFERIRSVIPAADAPAPKGFKMPAGMSNKEAEKWGAKPMPFGKHEGVPIDEVPMEYLEWLDQQDNFRADLGRYLLSDRVQAENK